MKVFVFAALLSAGLLSTTGDVSGEWTIAGDVQGYPINETCTFVQTEAKLTGTCVASGKKVESTGIIEGNKVVFKHAGEYQGDPLTLTFTGMVAADGSFSGSIYVEPLAVDGVFAAKKKVVAVAQ